MSVALENNFRHIPLHYLKFGHIKCDAVVGHKDGLELSLKGTTAILDKDNKARQHCDNRHGYRHQCLAGVARATFAHST